jgi:hypothetical protein
MNASKSLPDRPSLESLRKQAKKIARDRSLTLRDAQLVLAREYGFAGWQDLAAEVNKRLGKGLEWAADEARRFIHDNNVDRLKQLLTEYPALLSWRGDDWASTGGLLGIATGAYGDAGDPQREGWFTRAACAELLIDAGAVVLPSLSEGLLRSRARGLLELFQRKGLLPHTLKFSAARGDLNAVRTELDEHQNDLATVSEAFICAGRFEHEAVASLLLDRLIGLDPDLGAQIDGSVGRKAFIKDFLGKALDLAQAIGAGPWKTFVIGEVIRAAHEGDVAALVRQPPREPWLLNDDFVWLQQRLIEIATLNDREAFIVALFDLEPALLRRQPPPPSEVIEIAFTYAKLHLMPLLTRIWPVADDLPHAAGMGDLSRVKEWFDPSGAPALGDLEHHYPYNDARARGRARDLHWSGTSQRVLDVALAYAVINRHFDVADFLLNHGADINTNWNSHEPASILHHLVFEENYESMQFLIDRGIDMTIEDYRWNSTAQGWARYGKGDEKMAQWLQEAERQRSLNR